jgi:PAS domain S-box-containing protein
MALPAETSPVDESQRHPPRGGRSHPPYEGLEQLLAHWPGPAAILDNEGEVLSGNLAAKPVLTALAERPGGLAGLFIVGAAFKIAATVPGFPAAQTYEVVPLPCGDRLVLLARDISLSIQVCAALADSRQRYKDLVGISADFAWETDASGSFVFVSPQGGAGYSPAELIGHDGASLLLEPPTHNAASPFGTKRTILAEEVWMKRKDGAPVRMLVWATPIAASGHPFAGARGVCRDVTVAVQQETALLEASNREAVLDRIMRTMRDEPDAAVLFDTIATTLAQAVGADGLAIWRAGPGDYRQIAGFGATAPRGFDPTFALFPRLAATNDGIAELSSAAGSAMAVATTHRQAANGAISLWRRAERGPLSPSERALVTAVAIQVGIGLALTGALRNGGNA